MLHSDFASNRLAPKLPNLQTTEPLLGFCMMPKSYSFQREDSMHDFHDIP